jgi:hypothetical protein
MMMNVEQSVECELAGENEVLGENLPQITLSPAWPDLGSNPGRRGGKPSTNGMSYGTRHMSLYLMRKMFSILFSDAVLFIGFSCKSFTCTQEFE